MSGYEAVTVDIRKGQNRQQPTDSVEKPATEIEAGTNLGTVWKACLGYASAGAAGIGISFASLRRFW
ncbi:MAG: hypothetical protein Q8R81_02495, partial [Novosphingobium sp.]|uniref:hypothetical protein n=1 Tax=Novosphingobium sp. TaxID=1874826 RepID=UPI0027374F9D